MNSCHSHRLLQYYELLSSNWTVCISLLNTFFSLSQFPQMFHNTKNTVRIVMMLCQYHPSSPTLTIGTMHCKDLVPAMFCSMAFWAMANATWKWNFPRERGEQNNQESLLGYQNSDFKLNKPWISKLKPKIEQKTLRHSYEDLLDQTLNQQISLLWFHLFYHLQSQHLAG